MGNKYGFPTFKHCKHCGKEFIEIHNTKHYCSMACYKAFESTCKSSLGHMTRTANDFRNSVRKLHVRKSGDPLLC